MYPTPDALHAAAWRILARGVADRRHPARNPALATIGTDGPRVRTVVLRAWRDGIAEIHTDKATDKVAEITADPRVALHVWVPRARLQIRLTGTASLVFGDRMRWQAVPEGARQHYGGDTPPGQPIRAPGDFAAVPDPERFTVVDIACSAADILHLGDDFYRRVRSTRQGDAWRTAWVAP
ncbi:pyridoxamine 5'-phosphate oxidase family protein [Thalassococcus sp. CAU 1522]|uniref:Pyridoxamine 5'-phosphate oxidase family protein n=1 Tax=Thalassococcus arenae TaxID=2851652 RepID=A0ABS6N5G4_9RHOB|nr:pyridoxamine 5'-phosphate oxidase family protein [Thalassococcus arenae]